MNGDNMPKVLPGYKEEAKNRMIDAALIAFSQKGYDQTTMDDVGRQMGVSKGAVYVYFKNKKELFHAIVERSQQIFQEAMRLSFEGRNVLEGAEAFIEYTMNTELKTNLYLTFEPVAQASRDEEVRAMLREDYERSLKMITSFMHDQRQRSIIRDDVDIDALARGVGALYTGFRVALVLGVDQSDVKRAWIESLRAMACPVQRSTQQQEEVK